MNTYGVIVIRYDEDGNPTELVDQYITADDAIDLMLHIQQNVPDASEAEEEEEEVEEDEPTPARKPRKCGNCGEPGHIARHCPKAEAESEEPAEEENEDEDTDGEGIEDPFVRQMVDMLRTGFTDNQIYNKMHDNLTDAQFREKLEAAKELI